MNKKTNKTNKKQPKAREENRPFWLVALVCGGIGLAVTVICALLFPLLMLKIGDPNSAVSLFSAVCVFFGSFVGAFLASKRSGNPAVGLVTCTLFFAVMLFVSLFSGRATKISETVSALVAPAAGCALGAYMPVLLRKNKKPNVKKLKKQRIGR